jgi:hypothetical protein
MNPTTAQPCPGNLQCNGNTCLSTCTQPNDCITGYTCAAGTCLKAAGQGCGANAECASNQCLGGFCCGSTCTTAAPCGASACAANSGACLYASPNTDCNAGTCGGDMLTGWKACDGKGVCQSEPSINCPAGNCDVNGCTSCGSDTDCGTYGYCQGNTCNAKGGAGDACNGSKPCAPGFGCDAISHTCN